MHVTMEGLSPLLMHNPQLIDPTNHWVKLMKAITGKQKKTEDDHAELLRLEWHGGLFLGSDGLPAVAPANPRRCFAAAATRHKMGKAVERGMFIMTPEIPVIYDGPRTVAGLWDDPRFRSVLPVKVGQARTMRCRPMFFPWRLEFEIEVETTIIDEAMIHTIVEEAGLYEGLGDGRRIGFGKFRGKIG